MLAVAREVAAALPVAEVGTCVLEPSGDLLRAQPSDLVRLLADGQVRFHRGRIAGTWPRLA
jgi:hypothetical protein